MLQNISGGTLSGDFSLKTNMFPAKNTPKIHRNSYFATPPTQKSAVLCMLQQPLILSRFFYPIGFCNPLCPKIVTKHSYGSEIHWPISL